MSPNDKCFITFLLLELGSYIKHFLSFDMIRVSTYLGMSYYTILLFVEIRSCSKAGPDIGHKVDI